LGLLAVFIDPGSTVSAAQTTSASEVQRIAGRIEASNNDVYRLTDLRAGETLYVYMRATTGNLDPAAGVLDGSGDLAAFVTQYQSDVAGIIVGGGDVAAAIDDLRNRRFLAWDDDGGEGYAAAFAFSIPADGDYRVLAGAALSSFGRATFGDYELLLGRNAPSVLDGEGQPSGAAFAAFEASTSGAGQAVQEQVGTIAVEGEEDIVGLNDLRPGDTLQLFVERTSGNLLPAVALRDFGNKPVQAANLDGANSTVTLEIPIPEGATGYSLVIRGAPGPDGQPTTGDYRLLIGRNAPDVLTGEATAAGSPIVKAPIEAQVGLRIERISEVDSEGEDFTVLGRIRIDWIDPALAFSPESCNCAVKVYTEKEFDRFLADVQSLWPDFTFFNQQGNRWIQNRAAAIWPDGRARYYEAFTTTFQADFNFRRFPFDTQQFPVYVELLFPADRYTLSVMPEFNAISSEHGEDEFILSEPATSVNLVESGSTGAPTSRFTFEFSAPRHLNYYILQIFVPILLIILISWFTFFMRDYTQRAQAAAANVLLFIAFSFSLTDNYPRLGYLTFLDVIMGITFIINTLVVLYNVYLKQLETRGDLARAERLDHFADWVYPATYVALFALAALLALRLG
jgi:hypothetical protein